MKTRVLKQSRAFEPMVFCRSLSQHFTLKSRLRECKDSVHNRVRIALSILSQTWYASSSRRDASISNAASSISRRILTQPSSICIDAIRLNMMIRIEPNLSEDFTLMVFGNVPTHLGLQNIPCVHFLNITKHLLPFAESIVTLAAILL
mmetsp:Transcript_88857/g.236612  ORF Transcript_88857/g.236612 Transcript_88857/m.236612 type:complete len:148 (+) Transcript_88857:488-931(+)